jgi:hypothetical protein
LSRHPLLHPDSYLQSLTAGREPNPSILIKAQKRDVHMGESKTWEGEHQMERGTVCRTVILSGRAVMEMERRQCPEERRAGCRSAFLDGVVVGRRQRGAGSPPRSLTQSRSIKVMAAVDPDRRRRILRAPPVPRSRSHRKDFRVPHPPLHSQNVRQLQKLRGQTTVLPLQTVLAVVRRTS